MLQFLMSLIHPLTKKDERGASAVEYGLLIAGIAAVIVVSVMALGPVIQGKFDSTCSSVNGGACPK